MTTIKCGGRDVVVPDSLELDDIDEDVIKARHTTAERRAAFSLLFPGAQDPGLALPVMGHQVYVLGTEADFVHVAVYGVDQTFESQDGWFEPDEVELWAYVPNAENERKRRIPD